MKISIKLEVVTEVKKDVFLVQTYQKMVTSCFLGGPRNSSLILCSSIHITAPTKRKNNPVTHHISKVNGCKKAQALESCSLTAVSMTSPDSIKGCVKSTILVLSVLIAMSPTAASNSYKKKDIITNQTQFLSSEFMLFNYLQFHTHI